MANKAYVRSIMACILTEKDPRFGSFVLWSATEELDYFKGHLADAHLNLNRITDWHPKRQKEWLAGRFLLREYLKVDFRQMSVTSTGKPILAARKEHFSISHCDGLVGLLYNDQEVGLDIQVTTDKIHRTASKFCSENDYKQLEAYYSKEETEHIVWNAKEAIFKAYGKGSVSYKQDINFSSIEKDFLGTKTQITLDTKEGQRTYLAKHRKIGHIYITHAIES